MGEIHHKDRNPLNNEASNLLVVCSKHHHMLHGHHAQMVSHPVRIVSIEVLSEKKVVYDIEMAGPPNFVLNQFIVHNSRRYITIEPEFYIPDASQWRSAPENSKQGSGDSMPEENGYFLTELMEDAIHEGMRRYNYALEHGVAPEQARVYLPAYAMYTNWWWSGSLQSVMHFLNLRIADDAQWEIQQYALAVLSLVKDRFPISLEQCVKDAAV